MADTRTAPPPLEARCPDCSICGKETSAEGNSFECEDCRCSWDQDGVAYEHGEWNNAEDPQCSEAVQPYLNNTWIKDDDPRKHTSFRCVRDADHIESSWQEAKQHAHPAMSVCVKGWV